MAGNMIITSGHTTGRDGAEDVHCPFPGPHSQPYSYSGYTASCLGKAHTVCGAVCIMLEVLGLGVDLENHRAAPGIWCGLLFVGAGVVSIICGKRNTKDWIKSSLVATLIASLFTTGPLINCSLATGNFGARLLCWMIMAATTAELVVALSNIVICTAAIWPQYFQFFGIQMLASSPPQQAGRVMDTFQVMYVPPTTESDYATTQPLTAYHPQSLSVNPPGLRPPTCVVIPPTPSPPPGTDEDSPTASSRQFNRT